jgi:hypothetical protein
MERYNLMSRIQVTHCIFLIFPHLHRFITRSLRGSIGYISSRITRHIIYIVLSNLNLGGLVVRVLQLVANGGMDVPVANWSTSHLIAYVLDAWLGTIISIYLRLVYIIETRLGLLSHLVRIMLLIVVLVHDHTTRRGHPLNFLANRWSSSSVLAIVQMCLRVVSVEWFPSARLVLACISRVALCVAAHDVRSTLINFPLLFDLDCIK